MCCTKTFITHEVLWIPSECTVIAWGWWIIALLIFKESNVLGQQACAQIRESVGFSQGKILHVLHRWMHTTPQCMRPERAQAGGLVSSESD